jgi:hypothetical protein
MRAQTILNTFLNDVTPSMHKVRRASLRAVLSSLLSGSQLSITALGRNIESKTTEKHQIKRSMRLCSNPHLYHEIGAIYSAMATRLIGQQTQPIILVDWSDLDPRKQHFLLRASVAIEGRSLTVLEEVHPLSRKEKPTVHKAFMQRLKALLPEGCQPIIVTDAGFRVPWFRLIESLGWDYVGRVRNRTFYNNKSAPDWHAVKDLYAKATATPKLLGAYQLCRRNPIVGQFCIYKNQPKGRRDLTAKGDKARKSRLSRASAEREKEPWLLATSLKRCSSHFAKKIVKIYQTRMQIEESFRDLKTGLSFNESKTRTLHYLSVLLLLAMLAQYVLFLLGMVMKLSQHHLQYQANSVKNNPVLSYQFIGLRAFRDRRLRIKNREGQAAYQQIQILMKQPLNV